MFFSKDGKVSQGSGQGADAHHGAEHQTQHRDATAALHHAVQQFPRAAEGSDAVLGALSTAVPNAHQGRTRTFGHLHDLRDLQRMHFAHASAVHAEVLRKAVDAAAVNAAVTCHHAVSRRGVKVHVVVRGPVGHKSVQFDEGPLIEEHADALPCRATARGADRLEFPGATALLDGASTVAKFAKSRTVDALHGFVLLNAVLDVLAGQRRGGFSPHRSACRWSSSTMSLLMRKCALTATVSGWQVKPCPRRPRSCCSLPLA